MHKKTLVIYSFFHESILASIHALINSPADLRVHN